MKSHIVVMGVSGCGKSSIGEAVAVELGIPFFEGDSLHPPANVEKMRQGTPLSDHDRWPWLDRVAQRLAGEPAAVVSCSALRRAYRDHIRAAVGGPVQFIHLAGDRHLLAARMAARPGHYMPVSLLDSQLATLEPPGKDEALTVDIASPPDAVVSAALDYLKGCSQ
jgi:gluconokinase